MAWRAATSQNDGSANCDLILQGAFAELAMVGLDDVTPVGFLPLFTLGRVRPVEMTIFDTRQMITADAGNGALILGGAGAGKTLIQIAWLACSTSNKILVETQGNVFDKDVPLTLALGRRIAVITSDLGAETATVNVLGTLNPEDTDFWDNVMWLASLVIPERGEHGTIERCSRELVACVIGNVVF